MVVDGLQKPKENIYMNLHFSPENILNTVFPNPLWYRTKHEYSYIFLFILRTLYIFKSTHFTTPQLTRFIYLLLRLDISLAADY